MSGVCWCSGWIRAEVTSNRGRLDGGRADNTAYLGREKYRPLELTAETDLYHRAALATVEMTSYCMEPTC